MIKNKQLINEFITNEALTIRDANISDKFYENWELAKKDLIGYFGDSLIAKKKVSVKKDEEVLRRETADFLQYLRDIIYSSIGHSWDRMMTINNILSLDDLCKNCLNKDAEIYSNVEQKRVKLQRGSKMSRIFKHIVPTDRLEEIQIKYSKIFNDNVFNGEICISIHPLDYLTMSVNDSGWQSCLNIYDGCYRAGTTALMNSPNTVVVYFKTSEEDTLELTPNLKWNDKKWRTLITLGEDFIHINREYPYNSISMREIALDFAQELFFGGTELSETVNKRDISLSVEVDGHMMYNDAPHHNTFVRHLLDIDKDEYRDIVICDVCTCPICGEEKDSHSKYLECSSCGDFPKCAHCGEVIDPENDDVYYSEYAGGYICYDCGGDFIYCDYCDDYVPSDHIEMVEGLHEWICKDCFKDTSRHDLFRCEDCGFIYQESEHDSCLCEDCLAKKEKESK